MIHFAGRKYVNESVENPVRYYDHNVLGTVQLVKTCTKHNCKNFVFSSSCTVYGNPQVRLSSQGHGSVVLVAIVACDLLVAVGRLKPLPWVPAAHPLTHTPLPCELGVPILDVLDHTCNLSRPCSTCQSTRPTR